MKQSEILKVLSTELGTNNLEEINKALKAKNFTTKFRMTGPAFVHFGFTGLIKSITQDGVKIYNSNRVNLIPFGEIETFAKAVSREERRGVPKASPQHVQKSKVVLDYDEEDYENDDDFDELADEPDDIIEDEKVRPQYVKEDNNEFRDMKKMKKKQSFNKPGSGSIFIPRKK